MDPDNLQPDTIFGPFRIETRLGSGGMSTVYKAQRQENGQIVALKLLHPELASDVHYLPRFQREASIGARLKHANIMATYEHGVDDGCHYIALEFIDGKDAGHYLDMGHRFSERRAMVIGRGVSCALQYAFSLGIIHRDIKPDNIMLGARSDVKLMDFGLAKGVFGGDNLTEPGVVLGSPLYMAPEQVKGARLDTRSDIYSLGATLYHLSTGMPPFDGDKPMQIMVQHVKSEPIAPNKINPALSAPYSDLILRMMAKKADDRFETPSELIKHLDRAITLNQASMAWK
jgi:serine/threonine protein kinase